MAKLNYRLKRALVCALMIIGLLMPWAATAQSQPQADDDSPDNVQPEPEPAIDDSRKPLSQFSRQDLLAAGFVFDDASQAQSRALGTLLASTAGLALRGIGHWYIDDQRTAIILLATQGTAALLVGSALAARHWGDSPAFAAPMLYLGSGLFLLSYFVDVLGTAYSDELGLPPNSFANRTLGISTRYNFIDSRSHEILHVLSAEVIADLGRVYARAQTAQEIALEMSLYGGTLGWRPWRGASPMTAAMLEVNASFAQWRSAADYERLDLGAHVGGSLDLGDVFHHLDNFALGFSVGLGQRFYGLTGNGQQDQRKWSRSLSYLPMELFAHLNLTDSLNARFAYSRSKSHFLQTTQDVIGVSSLEFVYSSTNRLDLALRGELGSGFGISAALTLWLWD
ncbi:MAG: hypothetical protein H0U74_15660 [Bradymonadaceae bacterium]|nr:hypothetical protein [Lujinxingiaceae bacterium]